MRRLLGLVALFALSACGTPPSVAPAEPTDLPGLGQTFTSNGLSFSAVKISDPQTGISILYTPEPNHRLVAIQVIVGNDSGKDLHVQANYFTLIDADNFIYKGDNTAIVDEPDWLPALNIASGEKVRGWVAFTIPESSVLASIKFVPIDEKGKSITLQVSLKP